MESGQLAAQICSHLQEVFTTPISSPSALSILVDEITSTPARDGKVFLFSVGREGLMMQALCMRLYHCGFSAHFVFDLNNPPCTAKDLLIVSAGPGSHETIRVICKKAKGFGARVVLLTAQPDSCTAVPYASLVGHIPAQTMANQQAPPKSAQGGVLLPMGSVYEGALFILSEMVVYKLTEKLKLDPEQLRKRHTNLE